MKKLISSSILAVVISTASLASAQTFGPTMMGGGFAGLPGTAATSATTPAAWPMFGFGAQSVSQSNAVSQTGTAQQNLSAFMPMLQWLGGFGTN